MARDRVYTKRKVSFVGTADYIAPETLSNTSCSCAVDLWALGCVVYQMVTGTSPFRCVCSALCLLGLVRLCLRILILLCESSESKSDRHNYELFELAGAKAST